MKNTPKIVAMTQCYVEKLLQFKNKTVHAKFYVNMKVKVPSATLFTETLFYWTDTLQVLISIK